MNRFLPLRKKSMKASSPRQTSSQRPQQSGSALIYIFIGVILFAALALVFARGARQGGGSIDAKTAKVGASEIIHATRNIHGAVEKMIQNGISEADIGFTNAVTTLAVNGASYYSGNPNCLDATCQIFDAAGGAISPQMVASAYVIPENDLGASDPMPGDSFPAIAQIKDLGSAEIDLLWVTAGLKLEVCKAINDAFKVENPGGFPPVETALDATNLYVGQFSTATILGNSAAEIAGQQDFCYKFASSDPSYYVYVHTLLIR